MSGYSEASAKVQAVPILKDDLFALGKMQKRMGDEVHQDQAIILVVMYKLIEGLDFDFARSKSNEEKGRIADQAVFVLAVFLAVLREEEVFKLVLSEARGYLLEGRNNRIHPHVVLPLRGSFKGGTGENFHFVVVTVWINSRLAIWKWLERGIAFRERRGVVRGYCFTNSKGGMVNAKDLEVDSLNRIARIQQRYPDLIRPGSEVHEEYGLSRSFRRGSKSEVKNRGVSDSDIDRNNRWRKVEKAEARKPKLKMRENYIDMLVSLEIFLRYSQAL